MPQNIEDKLKETLEKYFDHIIFKKNNIILYNTEKLPDNIDSIINSSMKKISQYKIKKWKIVTKKFKVGNELTPSYKLRRNSISTSCR